MHRAAADEAGDERDDDRRIGPRTPLHEHRGHGEQQARDGAEGDARPGSFPEPGNAPQPGRRRGQRRHDPGRPRHGRAGHERGERGQSEHDEQVDAEEAGGHDGRRREHERRGESPAEAAEKVEQQAHGRNRAGRGPIAAAGTWSRLTGSGSRRSAP